MCWARRETAIIRVSADGKPVEAPNEGLVEGDGMCTGSGRKVTTIRDSSINDKGRAVRCRSRTAINHIKLFQELAEKSFLGEVDLEVTIRKHGPVKVDAEEPG